MTEETPMTFRKRFIEVSDREINLKFLFDHMRNYLICGALMFAGVKVMFKQSTFLELPYMSVIAGGMLFVIGYGLFWMNIFQGMFAVSVYGKLKPQNSPWLFIAFVVFSALLSLTFMEFMGVKFA